MAQDVTSRRRKCVCDNRLPRGRIAPKAKQAWAKWQGEQKGRVMHRRDAIKLGFKDRIEEITDGQ